MYSQRLRKYGENCLQRHRPSPEEARRREQGAHRGTHKRRSPWCGLGLGSSSGPPHSLTSTYFPLPGGKHFSWIFCGQTSTHFVWDNSWQGSVHWDGHWSGHRGRHGSWLCCGQLSWFNAWHWGTHTSWTFVVHFSWQGSWHGGRHTSSAFAWHCSWVFWRHGGGTHGCLHCCSLKDILGWLAGPETNISFENICINHKRLKMKVWERGMGSKWLLTLRIHFSLIFIPFSFYPYFSSFWCPSPSWGYSHSFCKYL